MPNNGIHATAFRAARDSSRSIHKMKQKKLTDYSRNTFTVTAILAMVSIAGGAVAWYRGTQDILGVRYKNSDEQNSGIFR